MTVVATVFTYPIGVAAGYTTVRTSQTYLTVTLPIPTPIPTVATGTPPPTSGRGYPS